MNENHQRLCPSPQWAGYIQGEVLPSLAGLADFGSEMLEIGPGPGAATEWLRHRVERLVALEIDEEAAKRLVERYGGTNVEVVVGDATHLDYPDENFDSVGSFTMLHHVRTLERQRAILAEAARVLRPGGALVGSDSLASVGLHEFHAGDSYNPIDPAVLLVMLRALGFVGITLKVDDSMVFAARKPSSEAHECGMTCGEDE
jgi:ubiquinone/menaquinone biosynthesis C-methylase UbiE